MYYNDSYRKIHDIPRYYSVRQYKVEAEVGSASHKSCAASARATTLKILRRKRFR